MEESEIGIRQAHAAATPSLSGVGRQSLNEDPSCVLAEQLAMDDCMRGFEVVQEISETEMVITSCGAMLPGTPDGGFTDSHGLLRLVQVVRVPLLPGMDVDEVSETLYDTVLAKIVKSQTWMRQTGILPHDFVIFCWLPPVGAYEVCIEQSDELLWTGALLANVRSGGWPFSLRIQVPDDPSGVFPTFFARGSTTRERKHYFSGLCYSLNPTDFEADEDDEFCEWHFFDQEFDDDTIVDEAVVEDVSSNLQALIALAIQTIEHAGEVQNHANVDACSMDLLLVASNEDGSKAFQFLKALSLHSGPIPDRYDARAKRRGAGGEAAHASPLLEGLQWLELTSAYIGPRSCPLPCGDRGPKGLPLQVPFMKKVIEPLLSDRIGCAGYTKVSATFDPSLAKISSANNTKTTTGLTEWCIPQLEDVTLWQSDPGKSLSASRNDWHLSLTLKAELLCFICAA